MGDIGKDSGVGVVAGGASGGGGGGAYLCLRSRVLKWSCRLVQVLSAMSFLRHSTPPVLSLLFAARINAGSS